MTDTDSTDTAELADVRPPYQGGEYFYTDEYSFKQYNERSSYATCFVCGKKGASSCGYYHIYAAAQCMAAGRRIAAMFKPEACSGPDPNPCLKRSVAVVISACGGHRHCAEILCRLTADGIITLERVRRAEKSLISHSEFNERVANEARAIWSDREEYICRNNWFDAWDLFLKETGRIPSLNERRERARQLWLKRKDGQAVADWLEAEKKVAALYTVAP